jgi:hypothetical protein
LDCAPEALDFPGVLQELAAATVAALAMNSRRDNSGMADVSVRDAVHAR